MRGRTENKVRAAQYQTLQTEHRATKILQTETDSKYRLGKQFFETVESVVSACQILTKEWYIEGHDMVCAQVHFNLGVKLDNKHWYDHVPK
jgi:hypothetical protein